ncbi:extracellular solute-binding protein [Aurantimonas sp. VKM B-3413]|uniref:extracellular solute-binding protein n=1 Tax=Aurantimonas sp. VKM B-3413 TaxID=2779401 RepID=UPI001E483F55|nr:extracellular solute-binding protein [Aurantimonas sp. VKM B-3413]MCB8840476.1 extracellular solute-binding protein [Aurantimonas sp. VKM B-3413]
MKLSSRTAGHLLGALLAATAAAGPAAAQEVTLTFANWASAEGTTRDGIEKVIAAFEEANPDINIESESIAFSEIERQLVLRLRSGNPPDVAQVAGNTTFVLAAAGALAPLNEYAGKDVLSQLKKGSYESYMVDGNLIAFPWNQATAGFWYNKKIMADAGLDPENPPRTIEELDKDLAAIKEKEPNVIPLGLDTTNRAFSLQSNWPWMRTFGALPAGPDATGAETKEMADYLDWMRMLSKNGYIDPGRKIGEFRPMIANGQVAFLWDQVLVQGVIQSTNGMSDEEFNNTYGVTTMPAGPSGKPYAMEGGHQLVIFKDSEHKDAAWKFIKFLALNEDAVKTYTIGANKSLPPAATFQDPDVKAMLDTPVIEAYSNEIIPTIVSQPYGPDFSKAATAIMAGVQEAVTSERPIDQITADIQSQLDR